MNFTLTTERLVLRVLYPEDAFLVTNFYKRNSAFLENREPNVSPILTDTSAMCDAMGYELDKTTRGCFIRYWYAPKESPDSLYGTVCLQNITMSAFHSAGIGYKQDIACMGRGYATEAVAAVINEAFANGDIHRIGAQVLTDNQPSIKLLEKLGFHREGIEKSSVKILGEWRDCYRYALLDQG